MSSIHPAASEVVAAAATAIVELDAAVPAVAFVPELAVAAVAVPESAFATA